MAASRKKRCYIYTRVSTQIQVDGYSLDAQRDRLLKAAEYEGMTVAAEFSDEGKSGKNTAGRPQFTEMMDRIQNGNPDKVDYVLVFKLSRFGRNTADVMNSLQTMVDNDVNLLAVEDKIDSSGPAGKLMVAVLAAVAEIERENILVQSKSGQLQKAREGGWNGGPPPLGYRLVPDANGVLEIDPETADIVRLIFDKYVHTGMGYSGIAKWLNKNGYRRPVPSNGKYGTFTDLTVRTILDNPVYTGKIVHQRYVNEKVQGKRNEYRRVKRDDYKIYDGMHEAIISDETWELAQAKRKATAGKPQEHYGPKHVHVLSGIVLCPSCGRPMYGNVSGRRAAASGKSREPLYYYICKNAGRSTGTSCPYRRSIREEKLDKQVVEVIQQAVDNMYVEKGLIMALGNSKDLDRLEANLETLRAERAAAEKKKSRLLAGIEDLDADSDGYEATFRDLRGIVQKHNQAIAGLDGQIEELSARISAARNGAASFEETLRMFHRAIRSLRDWPAEQLRTFLHRFLDRVEIFPEPLPGGQLVKRIRLKFPVSLDGGLTYSDVIDMDPGGDGEELPGGGTPPDSGSGGGQGPESPLPDSGSGGGQGPESPLPGEGVLLTEDVLPNLDIRTAMYVPA